MAESDEEKTEEPTYKKMADARKEGQIALSREVNNFAVLLGLTLMIGLAIPYVFNDLMRILSYFITNSDEVEYSAGGLGQILVWMMREVGIAMIMPIIILLTLGLLASLSQSGILFSVKPITPKLEKISPIKGLKRIFSLRQLVEFIKGLLKISIVGGIGLLFFIPEMQRMDILASMPFDQLLNEIYWLLIKLLTAVLAIMLVIATADVFYQQYEHHKSLKMTRTEVKEEYKNTEGNPEIKNKLRQIRMNRHRQNMREALKTATVVVTNPTHFAVALRYEHLVDEAPIVLAKGQDYIALEMRKIAVEYEIPIVENPPLARALYEAAEIDQAIPDKLFQAVSEVIGYVMNLKK